MTSRREQYFSYEHEYDYSQSAPWIDHTQTSAASSSTYHQLSNVNVTLIPEICASEDNTHFDQAVTNNDVDVEDDERYIDSDDNDMEIEDDDDGVSEENVEPQNLIHLEMPEFGDANSEYAVCTDWDYVSEGNVGELEVKQVFQNKAELLNAVKSWHIENNYQYKVQRSNTEIVQLKCLKDNTCRWYLRAMAKESISMWMITVLRGPHTCTNTSLTQGHRQLDSEFLGNAILEIVRADLKISVAAIQAFATTQLKQEVSYSKAYQAKQKAMERLFGTFEASYGVLPKFFGALQMSNPGTIVHFDHKNDNNLVATFGRVFWAFRPCVDGFQYCRPLISIDGTHLYGKYKGKLLVAVGFDADNGLFPLCYALVDAENNQNWAWFIRCIRAYVTDRRGMCVLSDRHPSIKRAMREQWPEPFAFHRYCVRHLASNLMTKFKDNELKKTINIMAREKSRDKFDFWMTNMKEMNVDVWRYLDKEEKERWALSYDDGYRYGIMTTNMSEIFNSVLKGGRFLPITALVQFTFYRSNNYFVTRRILADQIQREGKQWPEKVTRALLQEVNISKKYHARQFNHNPPTFQVSTSVRRTEINLQGTRHYTVEIGDQADEQSCTCNVWMLYHRPCSHVIACCSANRVEYSQFVEWYFTSASYLSSYLPTFHPIPDETGWPIYNGPLLVPDPEQRRSKKGRPRSTRLTNEMDMHEGSSRMTFLTPFTVIVHHSGFMVNNNSEYKYGCVGIIELGNVDEWTKVDCWHYLENELNIRTGYSQMKYLKHDQQLPSGLIDLIDEVDYYDMAIHGAAHGEVHLYVCHHAVNLSEDNNDNAFTLPPVCSNDYTEHWEVEDVGLN